MIVRIGSGKCSTDLYAWHSNGLIAEGGTYSASLKISVINLWNATLLDDYVQLDPRLSTPLMGQAWQSNA